MKITLILECEIAGTWLPEYEDVVVDKLNLPGVLFFGDTDSDDDADVCDILVNTVEWQVEL